MEADAYEQDLEGSKSQPRSHPQNLEQRFFTVCLGVSGPQTPLWKGVSQGYVDISLGPELLYQFFIKTSHFLFIMPMGSLKMALPIGDTSKAFSQFFKIRLLEEI